MLYEVLQSIELFAVVVAVTLYLLDYRPSWAQRSTHPERNPSEIPGPWAMPILGTGWIFSRLGGYEISRVHEYYKGAFERMGPIVKDEALWNVPVINVMERQDIEKVLRSSGKYPIRPPTEAIAHYRRKRPDRYASTGMVNEQGKSWFHLRTNLTSELISAKTVFSYIPQIEAICDDWCHMLKQLRNKECAVDSIENLAGRFGLEAICTLVLGRRMGFLMEEETETTRRLANAVNNHFKACRDTYYGLPLWKLYPTKSYKELVKSEEEIYNLVLEIIESADNAKESIVLESILSADVDPLERTAALVDFIAAGIYTLRNSLIFLLHMVANDAGLQKRIMEDRTDIVAKACTHETFRYMPTANCLARITEEDLFLSNYRIPSGSVVICHTGLACRDETNFKNADDFLPDRWIDESTKTETNNAATYLVVPFGVGRRMCPGKRFIEQVLPMVLTSTIKKFRMDTCAPLETQFEFLIAPKGPVSMIFKNH